MWKTVLLLSLGALWCTVSASLPSPTSVIISSVNLRNVLEWTPGNGTPGDAIFTVQYAVYGDSDADSKGRRVRWRAVQGCVEVAQSWCDLSNETWDLEHGYYARVRAKTRRTSSTWVFTRRFDPKSDTTFGPPLVTIEIENNSAIITIKGPMRYQPKNHMAVVSMATLYPQMLYNLSVKNTYHGETSHFRLSSGLYKHLLSDYNTEYCFSVKAKFLVMPIQCQSSEWQCITTPQDPLVIQLQWVIMGIVVPFLCVCVIVVIGRILYQYLMGMGQKTPYTLDQGFFNQPSLAFPLEKINLNAINDMAPADPMPDQHFEDPPPQYARYLPPQLPYDCGHPSIDYSFVFSPSTSCRQEERMRGRVNDEGGNNLNHQKDHSSGVYAPQATSSCLGRSFHADLPEHSASAELSAPEQAGTLHIPLNLKGDKITVSGMEEKNANELEPLLSVYAAHNTKCMAAAHSEQSDFRLADDLRAMGLEETEKDGGGHAEGEEQEREIIFIDWDPKLGKLVLPELAKWIDSGNEPENGGESNEGGEEEGNVMEGALLLGDVFVRQASEEEEQAPREPERDPEGGGEGPDILAKWNLVFPSDD
ncbi:interleukin-20 receptor subunit alpha [Takifugu flavidus]|uniref:Interleukin-20 receptor subunit alpha n=2 Tax=Takifugu TaxID=31032 RepID=A0A5C6NQT9_9TELE|nr:interleukin-20 receptor subunit alpha [Takifugu flavidus]XP_056872501.1 interleukin-20 receptor subunit alpha [Takifugu flavidus]TNM95060.1 hypothetical protein fugu_017819 [Takifugu bimaculatus]TWW69009.1 Interleukin-20 receptor subunit alpha [Takifugu flavidus]